jgi:TRAP-type C4-dicarboxylate transport system permease small subunit
MNEAPDSATWLTWVDRFSIFLAGIGGVATAGLMINIVIDVLSRLSLNSQLPGTVDLTQYAWMPTLVSLGLGYALLRSEHLRVDLLTAPTGPRTQRIIEIIGMAFTLAVTAMFIWYGIEKAMHAMDRGERAVGTPWVAVWPFRLVILVGMVGLLLQAIAQLVRAITGREITPNDEDEIAAALQAEQTVLDQLLNEPSPTERNAPTTARTETP